MARTLVPLVNGVWTTLGVGAMIVNVHRVGDGALQLNSAENDVTAMVITNKRIGAQIENTSLNDTISAKATGDDWEVVVDV